jgi:ribonuclease BN (tRNA processing enzyme)
VSVFDAADGTLPRLHQSSLKMANITRIFVTHMHADHVLGIVAILTTIMSGVGMTPEAHEKLQKQGVSKKVPFIIMNKLMTGYHTPLWNSRSSSADTEHTSSHLGYARRGICGT